MSSYQKLVLTACLSVVMSAGGCNMTWYNGHDAERTRSRRYNPNYNPSGSVAYGRSNSVYAPAETPVRPGDTAVDTTDFGTASSGTGASAETGSSGTSGESGSGDGTGGR